MKAGSSTPTASEGRVRHVLGGLRIPFVLGPVVFRTNEWAIYDLTMDEARATPLGRSDLRITLQEQWGAMSRRIPWAEDVERVFCVPMAPMISALINMAMMPEYPWMEPAFRSRLAKYIDEDRNR